MNVQTYEDERLSDDDQRVLGRCNEHLHRMNTAC
jgi:hypothetical protein